MEHKIAQFGNKGMSQDTSISKSSNELVFENRNIRITAREDGTLLSVTNEKGIDIVHMEDMPEGKYLGSCVFGNTLILFTVRINGNPQITKIVFGDSVVATPLLDNTKFAGKLNFSEPIETTYYYEREDVQKVYWVDGINPVRVINVAASQEEIQSWDESSFDFVPVVDSIPSVNISKTYGGAGLFPAGVIQYFFSYYNKYGQESKIIQASDLNYISFQDRGAKPDETVNCNFEITLSDLDQSFDYVRVYSAKRTAIDGPLEVHIVADVPVSSGTITVIDTNLNQEAVDSSLLYFIGGDAFVASTIEQKDNVLFLGDIKIDVPTLSEAEINIIQNYFGGQISVKLISHGSVSPDTYSYNNQLQQSSKYIKHFKVGEWYRIGVQLQDDKCQWTEPVWIQDIQIDEKITIDNGDIQVPILEFTQNDSIIIDSKYKAYRFVMVETTNATRKIVAQGVVNPTLFNAKERRTGQILGFASWITRPFNSNIKYKHMESLGPNTDSNSEIQNINKAYAICTGIENNIETFTVLESQSEQYYIDQSIITLNSPEISYGFINNINGCNFNINGLIKVGYNYKDYVLEIENPKTEEYRTLTVDDDGNSLIREFLFTDDNPVNLSTPILHKYYGYLYSKKGSLIGQTSLLSGQSVPYNNLKRKIIANYTYCPLTVYDTPITYNPRFQSVWNDENLVKLSDKLFYSGNYQKLSVPEESYSVLTEDPNVLYDQQFDPVYIKSSQTPHVVVGLPYIDIGVSQDYIKILPKLNILNGNNYVIDLYDSFNKNSSLDPRIWPAGGAILENARFVWKDVINKYVTYSYDEINIDTTGEFSVGTKYLFIGEIVKNIIVPSDYDTEADVLYGKHNLETELKKHKWIPISDIVPINETFVEITEGDTYFQRWECLRTYPTTEDDENSVIDIVSFMVETHINLDGRDDINRGPYNLLTKRPTNTNLFNDVYNQTNNIFEYNITDLASSESGEIVSKFSNQFAWSLAKSPLQQVDVWTNITMSAIQQVNGQYGPINEITKLGDTLVLFQDHAICTIDFNNRTQISTEQGLPIELANSGKVQGVSYITTMYGCKNKHSIVNTKTGIYFIDDNNQAFMNISKEGIKDISTSAGMSVWFKKNIVFGSKWIGGELNNGFVCKYDEKFGDIYIMNNNNCIVYNELLQTFTSFFDNYRYAGMWSLNQKFYALDDINIGNALLYEMFGGDYSSDYSITYKVNPEPYTDKIFTNLDIIADRYYNNDSPDDEPDILDTSVLPFTNIKVWNEYQNTGDVALTEEKYTPSVYKNKFRIRHIQLPRCIKADSKYKLDRIRNPWTFIKLSSSGNSTSKLQYHNMTVHYYE